MPRPQGSLGHEPLVFKARCIGGLPQEQVLKVGLHNVESKPSAQGEALGWSSLPIVVGVYNEIVSQPFPPSLMWSFSHVPNTKELFCQFLGCFFPEKIVPQVAVDSAHPWKEFKTLQVPYLNWNLCLLFLGELVKWPGLRWWLKQ